MSLEISRSYSFSYNRPLEEQNRDEIFKGPLADWARERREMYLEVADPMHLYFGFKEGQPHTAAWIFRHLMDGETGQTHWMFHVACDCMPEADSLDEPDIMYSCEVLAEALIDRAMTEGTKFIRPDLGQSILDILEQDRKDPKRWVANYINGQHEVPMLALMLGRHPDDVTEVAHDLEEFGAIELEEETLRLAA